MKVSLLKDLQNPSCPESELKLEVSQEDQGEVREGTLTCSGCTQSFTIHDGIVDMLGENLPLEVEHEREHAESFNYIEYGEEQSCPISRESIQRFEPLFLSLPKGDGSALFQPGGSFDNQAGNAERFFQSLELMQLTGQEKVLEVGASFSWGSRRFAQKGCDVVALDVTNYLLAADLFFKKDGTYYERVKSDMSVLPFKDETFDIIYSHSVIHHCKDLKKLFSEFCRVLKPGGRVVALHECSFGIFEDKSGKALQEAIDEGFNENAYTIPQWKRGALQGGFKSVDFHFFSIIDSYVYRKEARGVKETWKLKIARWIQKHPRLHGFLNWLLIGPRILLRPKAWMMTAKK